MDDRLRPVAVQAPLPPAQLSADSDMTSPTGRCDPGHPDAAIDAVVLDLLPADRLIPLRDRYQDSNQARCSRASPVSSGWKA